MKLRIASLNTQGGLYYNKLFSFLQSISNHFDVIGLQEVYHGDPTNSDYPLFDGHRHVGAFKVYQQIFSDFHGFFHSARDGYLWKEKVDFPVGYGVALFIKKGIKCSNPKEFYIYGGHNNSIALGPDASYDRNMQVFSVQGDDLKLDIGHFHGVHVPKTWKRDCTERSTQANRIVKIFQSSQNILLMGDMNLHPDAYCFKSLLNRLDLYDCITASGITSTRSEKYYKNFNKSGNTNLADFFLTSNVLVNEGRIFPVRVCNKEVSDHLLISMEIEI